MMKLTRSLHRRCRRFRTREDGSISVEFVLWVPVFLALMLLVADTSLIFMRQSNFWNVSRETARIVARHGLDAEKAEEFAAAQAGFGSFRPDVSVSVNANTVTVSITAQSRMLAPFGILFVLIGENVETSVTQVLEPV